MKPYTKMMLMAYGQKSGGNRQNEYRQSPRNEYDDERMEYGAENRFRDRRGREHYDNGRFAPMRNEMRQEGGYTERGGRSEYRGGENEKRGGYEGGRNEFRQENDRGGRFETRRRYGGRSEMSREYGEMEDEEDVVGDFWPYRPFVPPYGEGDRMNEIGFERGMNANYENMDEMKSRRSEKEQGYAMAAESFTPETAKEWTKSMHNEDGTKGPHWTMEQVKQVMSQRGIKHDPAVFWAILNSLYSDYCAVFKKHGVNNMDFYVDMTSAWINDKDAVKDKAGAYYEYVVKH